MNITFKRILGIILILAIVIGGICASSGVLERKDSWEKYADFYSQEEDFDILFLGTSHVMNAIYPMELWNDYGYTSYNFGGHKNRIATSYWVLRNALDYTNPKLVVLDTHLAGKNTKVCDDFSYLHQSFDSMPLSWTKVKALIDLLNDPEMDERIAKGKGDRGTEQRSYLGILWNYCVYHGRWSELTSDDYDPTPSVEKGAEMRINVTPGKLERIDSAEVLIEDTVGLEYIRKIVAECSNRGISVLLTYYPYPADEEEQIDANSVGVLAEELGVNYLNFLDLDVIDYETDCYDEASHLNPSGARKVTKYIGQYISENYDVENCHADELYQKWNSDYKKYCELKDEKIRECNSYDIYQCLLSEDDLDVDIKQTEQGTKFVVLRDGELVDEVEFIYETDEAKR